MRIKSLTNEEFQIEARELLENRGRGQSLAISQQTLIETLKTAKKEYQTHTITDPDEIDGTRKLIERRLYNSLVDDTEFEIGDRIELNSEGYYLFNPGTVEDKYNKLRRLKPGFKLEGAVHTITVKDAPLYNDLGNILLDSYFHDTRTNPYTACLWVSEVVLFDGNDDAYTLNPLHDIFIPIEYPNTSLVEVIPHDSPRPPVRLE